MGRGCAKRDSNRTQEKKFVQEEQSAVGKIIPGMR